MAAPEPMVRAGPVRASAGGVLWRGTPRLVTIGTRYSRFVGLMRFFLPLAAGLLIAMIVVWPQLQREPDGFKLDLQMLKTEQTSGQNLVKPRFTSADQQDRPFAVTAARAVQPENAPDVVELTEPEAEMRLRDEAWLMLIAQRGRYDRAAQTLDLDGGVEVYHEDGHTIRTQHAVVDVARGDAFGDSPVEASGPNGELSASGFQVYDKGARMMFFGAARLVMRPAQRAAAR
jgi:lipopolysaccharide export system protein LptC